VSHSILVVDDEADLVNALELNLRRGGYRVRSARDARTCLDLVRLEPPDLILLDLMLPDLPGTEICRLIRADPSLADVLIVMLTAKSDEIDRVIGLTLGADDFVTKPFSTRELLLRVQGLLRRARRAQEERGPSRFGRIEIDLDRHRVWIDGEEVRLTALELRLLWTFATRPGRVLTRENLLKDVWGMSVEQETRTVDTHVKRLREKLGDAGSYVETVRGVGYRFEPVTDAPRGSSSP
jgi:two-component system, OmpR family, phosphate regulon response regulator PhoB